MQSAELVSGRRIGVVLHSGDDVLGSIVEACVANGIRQGYIPVFRGAFRSVRLVASRTPIANQEVPLNDSIVVRYVEGIGSGSITWDERTEEPAIRLHAAVGARDSMARGHVGFVLAATTHYFVELVIEEVLSPRMRRAPDPDAFSLESLSFQPDVTGL